MLIEIGIVVASIVPVTVLGAFIGKRLTASRWPIAVSQILLGALFGAAAVKLFHLSPFVIVGTIVFSQTATGITLVVNLINRRQRKRALNGKYGDVTQWAAEIVQEGDTEFMLAMNALPTRELKDIKIIVEDKEELRTEVVERFDEMSDDVMPEEFE